MNKIILSCFFILSLVTVKAQIVSIPDDNFKAALIAQGVDANVNGQIEESEALATTQLLLQSKSIANLTGIKSFANLITLDCSNNTLSSIDLSNKVYLTSLICSNNLITNLNISNCSALTDLNFRYNPISIFNASGCTAITNIDLNESGGNGGYGDVSATLISLNLTNCSSLKDLWLVKNSLLSSVQIAGCIVLNSIICDSNPILTSLDASGLTNLKIVGCYNNPVLSSLIVNGDTALTFLDCPGNALTNLDVTDLINLTYLGCYNNALTSLDVSTLTNLQTLDCQFNQLTVLDLSGKAQLTNFNCSNNLITVLNFPNCTVLTDLDFRYNPISVFNASGCSAIIKFTPFNNNGYPQSNFENQSEGNISATITTLNFTNCNSLESLGLRGNSLLSSVQIDGCTSLNFIVCDSNPILHSLDASGLTNLKQLRCFNNPKLSSLIVAGDKALTELWCFGNILTSLDVSGLINLTELDCSRNPLTILNVSTLTKLQTLLCSGNSLSSLDVSNCKRLSTLSCYNNALTSLDVSNCTTLTYINCDNNALTNLDVSNCTVITNLSCYNNSLTSLEVSDLINLTFLRCSGNALTSLNLSTLTKLNNLDCSGNVLTSLDVSNKPITAVDCSFNNITGIYLQNGVANSIIYLIASNNISLESIYIDCGDVVDGEWSNGVVPKPASYITPTGAEIQTFNNAAKIIDLSAAGTGIKWYSSPTGGSELATTTDLVGGSFYYASQSPNGCESTERLKVKVIINTTTLQKFCSGAEVSNLYAEGKDVKWYSESIGGTALVATTVLTSKTYYVTETVAGIESARKVVEVIISPISVAGTISGSSIIYSGSATTLTLSDTHVGDVQWQSSPTSNSASFSDIVGTNSSIYATPILNSNIYYRAVVASGVCSSSITLPFKVTVSSSSAIIISNVSSSILNPGDIVNVSFEATDTFSTGNTFYLQLSDGTGNFANAQTIGSIQSQVGSTITGNIPYTILADCGYKLRVTSSLPLFGTPYTSNIQINSLTQTNVDYAVVLDGINDYIDMGTWFNKSKFTFSFWVKPDSVQQFGAAIADIQNDLILYSNPNTQDNYFLSRQLQFDLIPDKWNHVTITMDGETNTRKVYLFGQLITENKWNYSPLIGYDFKLGNGGFVGPNSYFIGQFDEVKLWDTVIPPNQILENVSKKLIGDESNLLGYWDFNNGCNPVATDLTSNHHDAILMNGVRKAASTISYVGNTIVPNHSANTGICRVIIYDELFSDNSIVKLTRAGFTDIISESATVNNSKNELTVFMNLAGKDLGVYNIEITEPNGHIKFYPDSFTIEQLDTLNGVDVQIVGTNVNRQGRVSKFLIVYQNTGNSDIDAPIFELHSYSSEYLAFSYKDLMYKWQVLPVLLGNQIKDDTNNFIDYDTVLSPGKIYTIPVFVDNNSGIDFTSSKTSTAQSPCSDISFFVLDSRFPNRPDIKGSENKIVIPYAPNNGHNFIDGCSAPEFAVPTINYFINSNEDWNSVFLNACATHDYCYQTCYRDNFEVKYKAQRICDLQLYNDSCRICDNYSGDKQKCYSAASYYLWGLRLGGIKAFYTNQTYCTGEVSDQPPPKGTGPTYVAPDCNNCPDGSLCFKQKQVRSYDPNEKRGPTKFQNLSSDFKYVVNFENKESATASAQQVIIIDSLDLSSFDLTSFSFGGVGFGNYDYSNSLNQQHFVAQIDLRPSEDVIVNVEGNLNITTGVVLWVFTSLDPLTMEPTLDPIAGFLPPNDNTGRGQGYVYYNIDPSSNLQTGHSIKNSASIIFDNNKPINTETWENIIDKIKPSSHVNPLNSNQNNTDIALNWTGSDVGSEIKYYDVYYSVDSSEFILWKHNSTDTSGIFIGENNHHYTFYSIATDSAGNVEDAKSNAEASTTISTLGINNNELINNVYVYPNPNKGDFNLVINSNINDTFELLIADLLGRRIYKQRQELNVGENIIPLNIKQSGIYLVTISNKNRTTTKKVIINK